MVDAASNKRRLGRDAVRRAGAYTISFDRYFFAFAALLMLATQGLTNFLVRGLGIEWWKQALIAVAFAFAALSAKRRTSTFLIFWMGIAATLLLVLTSILNGVDILTCIFNAMLYAAWIPFLVLARMTNFDRMRDSINTSILTIIIVSGVGILLQLYTPYFNFLIDDQEAFEYAAQTGVAQRIGFIYVASTLVMPTMVSLYFIACMNGLAQKWKVALLPFFILSVIATGSLGGAIMLVDAAFIAFARGSIKARAFGAAGLAMVLCLGFIFAGVDETAQRQLDRIFTNTAASDSNQGRLEMWGDAMSTIARFSGDQHVFGMGFGTTNGRTTAMALPHGESSFFQAYLETGIIGLVLRVFPLAALAWIGFARLRIDVVFHALMLFIVCGTAPIMGAFGLQCTLGYAVGLLAQQSYQSRARHRQSAVQRRAAGDALNG